MRDDEGAFEVLPIHMALLRRTYVGWDAGAYDGAPCVGLKRPYGNSDVPRDVREELDALEGVERDDEWWDAWYDADDHEEELAVHRSMETVVQIALVTAGRGEALAPGLYRKGREYDRTSWVRRPERESMDHATGPVAVAPPSEAVEAAAQAMYEADRARHQPHWSSALDHHREPFRAMARAAAPHLRRLVPEGDEGAAEAPGGAR